MKSKFIVFMLFLNTTIFSQNTGISDVTHTPVSSAVLDVYSTSRGMLLPRMTQVNRTSIASPATGLVVYQTDGIPGFYYYTGSSWILLSPWQTSGNDIYYNTGNVVVGTYTINSTYPEKLLVNAGTTTSVNAIVARGTINSYLQLNIQNQSTGSNASSDIVATADNGSETTNYVDMGINGSAYTGGIMGSLNDAYLYNIGQNLLIGTGSSGKSLLFLTGGTSQASNERMRINGSGSIGINTTSPNSSTKLDVNGAVKLGSSGSVVNNLVVAEFTLSSATGVPAANLNTLASTYSPGAVDVTATVPTLSGTRGSVAVSFDSDLPTSVSVAWARVTSTTQVKIRFFNNGTTARTIPAGQKFYISIVDF